MSAVIGMAVQAAAFMQRAGYSPGSVGSYRRIWGQFGKYCAMSGVQEPDRETAARFCAAVGADGAEQWQVFYRRVVGCLFDVAETGRFALRSGRGRVLVPEVFTAEFEAYASSLAGRGLAEATVRGKTGMLRRFLAFLAGLGVRQVAALSAGDVSAYVGLLASMAASSRAGQLYFLREYLRFAVREHGADPALGAMFPVIVTDRDAVLPSVYRPGEVAGALAEAGNRSGSGLRDRAVMLLASLLGLRSGDIKGLRFDQIDWANRRLSLVQHKTGRRLDLPLPDECALAIVDYWKNERPGVEDRHVFLRHRAPLQSPAAGNHFHQMVAGCFARAGVEISERHRGLHALRHSAAVGMLGSGTAYPVIGAVLGHADANTTRRYQSGWTWLTCARWRWRCPMAAEIIPDGAFPELFSEYVGYKRNLGYVYPDSRLYLVRRLSRFLAGRVTDERVLTRDAAEEFARPRDGESAGSAAGRRGIARQFALFLRWKGIEAWVLPEGSQPRQSRSFAPRIVTAKEMARVIACADARPVSRCGPQTQPVYAMLVRLLWCCGLRIGEAVSLRVGDVDLAQGVITVRKAKHNRTRLVPMSQSLAAHAHHYAGTVGLVLEDPQAWFFPSPRGGGYNPCSATAHIQRLMLEADITTATGRAPRTHDLRHSYAVACLAKMQADGVDVYAALPLLATYMGHADIVSAEYYLRLDPSAWAGIEQAMADTYAGVFPHATV